MSEDTKIGRRAIIAGAVAAAAAGAVPDAKGFEVGPIKLPITAPVQNVVDTPISGGHQTSATLFTNGANGINYRHDSVVTRIGNSMTIQTTITKIDASTMKIIGTEKYTHNYTGTPVSGGMQVNGNVTVNGTPQPALQLTFKGDNPYTATDMQTLVNQVMQNKRLM